MPKALPTVIDIARLAGVSAATVDRALHHRSGVRQATLQRVLKAAAELQYLPQAELYAAMAPPPMRLLFILPSRSSRFLWMLGEWVKHSQEHWAPYNVSCRVAAVESFDPDALTRLMLRRGKQCDGVAFMALEHPKVREAVADLANHGIPTVTLVSDLSHSQRNAYVGLDNRAAGRTAAHLIGRFLRPAQGGGPHHDPQRRAKVALLAGSLDYRAHEEREAGFLHLFTEQYPDMRVVGLREGYDDPQTNYRQTQALLKEHPDLAAIYNIGSGSEGIGQALKECGRQHDIAFIGHGLTPETRALLIDGSMDAVINQSPLTTILNSIRIFANLRDHRSMLSGVEATRTDVIFRENLP
ncbi:LacI family DNA-binding transcriptional regulator [Bordetella tumulicola]|uniref:LacI family DNA-binding transcriptional regulator n=1 Tax=Bordetella tumulicola TaxID=1649133 RepID=UPI0039EF7DB4